MSLQKQPLVSIGLPVYNGEKYIERAIRALLSQEYKNCEIIISDNCSTDQTEVICRFYAQQNHLIHYIRQSQNKGASFNFQYVLDQAKGKYFMWAAHDDWWDPSFVSELVNLLEKNPICIVAFSRLQHVDVMGNVFREYPYITELSAANVFARSIADSSLCKYLSQNIVKGKVNLIYGLMRRETLIQSNAWKEWCNFGWGADLLIVAQILRYGDACIYDRFLFRKTENPDSEGSLKGYVKSNNPFQVARGVLKTFAAYNKYCYGIWCVLRLSPHAAKIPLSYCLKATIRELIRSNTSFLQQASARFLSRIN